MRSQGKKTVAALLAFGAYGMAAVAVAGQLRQMRASVTDVTIQYLCGPTPVPGTTPHCPDISWITFNYVGYGCTSDDFYARVRKLPRVQLVTIFKDKAAKDCHLGDATFAGDSFQTAVIRTEELSPNLPFRLTNLVPVKLDPRP